MKKNAEELRRLMELRRSNAASAVPNKKKYDRKKCQSLMLELKKEREQPTMDFYDDYYETDMIRPGAKSCYCKLHSICTNCKESYN